METISVPRTPEQDLIPEYALVAVKDWFSCDEMLGHTAGHFAGSVPESIKGTPASGYPVAPSPGKAA
jgi:hypothetical protein